MRKLVPLLFSVLLNELEDDLKKLAGCPPETVKEKLEAINWHMSTHNKYVIRGRETFSKSRLFFRDNFS
jgi:hypothetical protein